MPGQHVRQHIFRQAKRIVVKVGTNAITDETGRPDLKTIRHLLKQIAQLLDRGVNVTLVASGAVGAGLGELNMNSRPKTLPKLQATAAVGQSRLMHLFHHTLRKYGYHVAQVLLSRDDFENRGRFLNIRNTLLALHDLNVLPVVNENDAVATEELKYGDNDIIAAHLTNMIAADLLVLLSSVDGVLDNHGDVIDVIEKVDNKAMELAKDKQRSTHGSGGMSSKIGAAGMVIAAGEAAVIANARTTDVIIKLMEGKTIGTVFVPAEKKLTPRQRWIGLTAKTAGKIILDDGAVTALTKRGKSLLPSGIQKVMGTFQRGDTIAILDSKENEIARGLTNYSAEELSMIKGLKSNQIAKALGLSAAPYAEAVHRNNLTLIG